MMLQKVLELGVFIELVSCKCCCAPSVKVIAQLITNPNRSRSINISVDWWYRNKFDWMWFNTKHSLLLIAVFMLMLWAEHTITIAITGNGMSAFFLSVSFAFLFYFFFISMLQFLKLKLIYWTASETWMF